MRKNKNKAAPVEDAEAHAPLLEYEEEGSGKRSTLLTVCPFILGERAGRRWRTMESSSEAKLRCARGAARLLLPIPEPAIACS